MKKENLVDMTSEELKEYALTKLLTVDGIGKKDKMEILDEIFWRWENDDDIVEKYYNCIGCNYANHS